MCVESIECTKLGGKAVVFFDLLTGWSSRLSAVLSDYKIVWITVVDEMYLYGCTQGKPSGEIHLTGSPEEATTLAHLANQSFI